MFMSRRRDRLVEARCALCIVIAGALVAAGCSGGSPKSAAPSSSTPSTSTPATAAPTPTSTTTPTAAAPGGAVPAGFSATSYTAISADYYWLLGSAPCDGTTCTSIIRTTDGGAHFVSVPAPPAPLAFTSLSSTTGQIDSLRFADPLDGYAFGASPSESNAGIWVTHDGGERWTSVPMGQVLAFDVSDGEAFAVVGNCTPGGCSDVRLERSVATTDNWLKTPLPSAQGSYLVSISAQQDQVWINADSGNSSGEQLLHSADRGATFSTGRSPCDAGLGGTVQATSDDVLWFTCPTGMMAQAVRSSDGGATFESLDTGPVPNSARVAPADSTTAVLVNASSSAIELTTDAGASFHQVFDPPGTTGWIYAGFTTPEDCVAIATLQTVGTPYPSTALWRTTDRGITWQQVSY
jgi:hypothetical protein